MNVGDWSADELREALFRAVDWTVSYREGVERYPVLPRVAPGDVRERLGANPPREPEPFERVLADFDEHIVGGLTHWNHPGFLAYFSSCARGPSIAAELLIAYADNVQGNLLLAGQGRQRLVAVRLGEGPVRHQNHARHRSIAGLLQRPP